MDSIPSNEFMEVKGVKMTKGTLVILILGVTLWLAVSLLVPGGWASGLLILLSSFVAAYTQNCVILGHCSLLAVFLLAMYVFSAFITIISVLIITSKKGRLLKKLGNIKKR